MLWDKQEAPPSLKERRADAERNGILVQYGLIVSSFPVPATSVVLDRQVPTVSSFDGHLYFCGEIYFIAAAPKVESLSGGGDPGTGGIAASPFPLYGPMREMWSSFHATRYSWILFAPAP